MRILDVFALKLWHSDPTVRSAAVAKIKRQDRLIEVALVDPDSAIATAAVERISDSHALAHVACNTRFSAVGIEAVSRITDEGLLARIAKASSCRDVVRVAVRAISNEQILASIAGDPRNRAGDIAVEAITSDEILTDVARKCRWPQTGVAAVDRIKSNALVSELAMHSEGESVGVATVNRLPDDEVLLLKIALFTRNAGAGQTAVARMSDETKLAEVAKFAFNHKTRDMAASRVTNRELLADIAKSGRNPLTSLYAVWRVFDRNVLKDIASNTIHPTVRVAAQRLHVTSSIILRSATPPKWFLKPAGLLQYAFEKGRPHFLDVWRSGFLFAACGYTNRSSIEVSIGLGLLLAYASGFVYFFSRNLAASRDFEGLYKQESLRFLDWIDDGPTDWKISLQAVREMMHLQREAEHILSKGGPSTFEEYMLLFPRACAKCGFREVHHWARERSDEYSSWYAPHSECLRCGASEIIRPLSLHHCESHNYDREVIADGEWIDHIFSPFFAKTVRASIPIWRAH